METIKIEFEKKIIEIASKWANGYLDGITKDSDKMHKRIMKIYQEVKMKQWHDIFKNLLNHDNIGVQLWSATFLLEIDTYNAEKKLLELSNLENPISLMAEMILDSWKNDELELL